MSLTPGRASVLLTLLGALAACDSEPTPVVLDTSIELLDGFEYDTGELPGDGPVQVSLRVSGGAVAKLLLPAIASDEAGEAALYAAGAGTIEVSGGFALDGTLKVDQSGLPGYDGDIPGLADISLPLSGTAKIDAFAIGEPATVSAALTPGDLPAIPLPGGVPGTLQLSIAEGSAIDVSLQGLCAGVDGDSAEYRATAVRGGTVNIGIAVDLEIPFAGTKTFDIGTVAVAVPESSYDVAATKSGMTMQTAPAGATAAPTCATPGEGGGDAGGNGSGGNGAGANGTGANGSGGNGSGGGTTSGGDPECLEDTGCGPDEGCNSEGVCKPITYVCVNQTAVVDNLELVQGDREFGGNGPLVHLTVQPSVDASGILFDVFLSMTEVGSDQSRGERTAQFVFTGDFDSIHDLGIYLDYVDENTELDMGAGTSAYPQVRCMGDTAGGTDICNGPDCSYCEIDIGCMPVTLP
jgi:hypothetical protein